MYVTPGELEALREAAERAWGEDTRHQAFVGHPFRPLGQCYVTSCWLAQRLGGYVGRIDGHYFYLTPDKAEAIDLTGDRYGAVVMASADDPRFAGHVTVEPWDDARLRRFRARADHEFDHPPADLLRRVALDYGGDALPGEEPQAVEDRAQRYWHDQPDGPANGGYQFVYANGGLEVSPFHSHDDLAEHLGLGDDHKGPIAVGTIEVTNGVAIWRAESNVSPRALTRIFKDSTKHYGWSWGGLTDIEGMPVNDEFGPDKKTQRRAFCWADGHLYLGLHAMSVAASVVSTVDGLDERISGYLLITDSRVKVTPSRTPRYFASLMRVAREDMKGLTEALLEWTQDEGLTLLSTNNNVIKRIEDLSFDNLYDPDPKQPDDHQYPASDPNSNADVRQPGGVYRCPNPTCGRIFPSWDLYLDHRMNEESLGDAPHEDGGFPEQQDNPIQDSHFTPQQPMIDAIAMVRPATLHEARQADGFRQYEEMWKLDRPRLRHYVAFAHGCPVGYATMDINGDLVMIQTAVRGKGLGKLIMAKLQQYHTRMRTHAMNDHSERLLRETGWFKTGKTEYRWAKGVAPKDAIEGPIPFIYDVQDDKIHLGEAGARTSDIPGRFTPGGIVEGIYEPGGKVIIKTMTNQPYTARHLLELWYYSNPMLEVRSVHLRDDAGKDTKLAHEVGGTVLALAMAEPAVERVVRTLEKRGGTVYVVGGAVRDIAMGLTPKDYDILVTGVPDQRVKSTLQTLPGRAVVTGKRFGVTRYRDQEGYEIEVALPRKEASTQPGHNSFDVTVDPALGVEDDLYRRDFTVNAMAVETRTGRLIDPFGGLQDIGAGTLRTLGEHSFADDALRTVRALVAYARLGLAPDDETREQMSRYARYLTDPPHGDPIPGEALRAELEKLLAAPDPSGALRLAHATGVLKYLLPEVDAAWDYDQRNPHHAYALGTHLLHVLDGVCAVSDDADLRLAALMHDVGKPASAWWHPEDKRQKFYALKAPRDLLHDDGSVAIAAGTYVGQDHAQVGADLTRERMAALAYSNDRIDRVTKLITHHMFGAFDDLRGARRFLNRVGDAADDLFILREADQGNKGTVKRGSVEKEWSVENQKRLVTKVRESRQPTAMADLAINGHDLIAAGVEPGPKMGEILAHLVEEVLEDPDLNERFALLQKAQEMQ